jgi:hypothetical protein
MTVALPCARLSVERSLGARFRVGLQGLVGIAAPRPSIQFDHREIADWGRPLFLLTFDLGIALD